jgi:capsule polysaccharide export protein KpsC/LpsZ
MTLITYPRNTNNITAVTILMEKTKEIACRCHHLDKITHATLVLGFEARVLHTSMVPFLLSNLSDGWTAST